MYQIPMKGEPKKDFVTQIDWKHFHGWHKKAKGAQAAAPIKFRRMGGK